MAPSDLSLAGKVALVTGSSRGMGRQNALELASRGADIVVNYAHSSSSADEVVCAIQNVGRRAIAIKANMSQPSEIASLFEQALAYFSHIDIVVSNSGVEHFGHISDIKPEEFDAVFAVNTRGQLLVAQQVYKYVATGGRLIMLSSISAQARGVANHSLYSGSKAAVEAFARCLAVDFGDRGITVNAIAPGGVKTDMYAEAARKYIPGSEDWDDEKIEQIVASWSPLKRTAIPEDIARVVVFLASEDAGWVNGQTIAISGGAAM